MILYEKLKNKYGDNLKEKLSERLYHKMAAKKSFYLHNIVKCGVDLDELGYTFEDYLEDFRHQADKYAEKRTLFNILKKGYAPGGYSSSTFQEYLRKGFNSNSQIVRGEDREEILDVLDIDCDLARYNLRCEVYRRHIELYGAKEDLERFQEDFSIKQSILWEKRKEEWHLAFDGLLADYIKNSR
ncbi:hypothetical protein PM10SUCC1_38290 [Propionigenium maris DSM 9537]|uniref:Uncharacterized protein n=1 Tax=Propionigenium maris DSM 9537 TaxID=1123000 RepID=A0A9W6GPW9_9FUSO|nr:hypothetical protein [Propionigenium maris]GLI58315.1 hypothetical protein PM10SUCC1_38290 [Propionigenium maris DSM 9537]